MVTTVPVPVVCPPVKTETRNHGVGSSDHIILKNVLTVDASKHHMVDACSALFPYLSGHIISGNIA